MRVLSPWSELGALSSAALLAVLGVLALSAFLPGRRLARLVAAGVAIATPLLEPLGLPLANRLAWAALWAVVAWRAGDSSGTWRPPGGRAEGVESGTIGLFIGVGFLGIMLAAVARQPLSGAETRLATYGLALIVVGLLHLMLRRDARRAMLAFGALGLGLDVLARGDRDVLLPGAAERGPEIVIATAVALALIDRLAGGREAHARSPWVSDAHDLHD